MKMLSLPPVFALLIFFGSIDFSHADVAIGDTREAVLETLGTPTGYADVRNQEAYSFDRGRVIFSEGRVVSHTIVSAEEAERQQQISQREREERREQGMEMRERLMEEPEIAGSTPEERLAFFDALRQRYPDVDVSFEHSVAVRQVEAARREEMRDLELRLMEAERMAELAEKQIARAPAHYYGSGFPLVFTDPQLPGKDFAPDSIRGPRPMPPTGREQFMPLQSPQAFRQPAYHPHGQQQRNHTPRQRLHQTPSHYHNHGK